MSASEALREAFAVAQARSDRLFTVIRPDAIYERPIPERHRLIFYLGHLEAFDWNLLWRNTLERDSFHPSFDRLFAFGIDPVEGNTPTDQPADWPSVGEVHSYNERVRSELNRILDNVPEERLQVAIEHRLMHLETLAYLLHQLPFESKITPQKGYLNGGAASVPTRNEMLDIPPGEATLGRPHGDGFGWDNEFDQHTVGVRGFSIAKYKVTNGEYLEFVRNGAPAPHFWRLNKGDWYLRTMFADVPLPLDWPVYVTHAEAQSYCEWRGEKLPTEAQFHRAAYGTTDGDEHEYPWGERPGWMAEGNFDFQRWDPVAVDATPGGDSSFNVSQLVGNGWEWTSTVFGPFPGFEPFSFYPGYSADFFDGSHFVMKGGSPQTAARLLRRSFRNWFRPHYPYVYAGFRTVDE